MSRASETCPLCRRPSASPFTPFCSARCKDRDLLAWLGEGYRIPGRHLDPDTLSDGLDRPGGDG